MRINQKIRTIVVSAAMIAALTPLRAQSLEPFNPYGIFSPSVEAWQMTRYGNLTPSLYTGAMTFSLPLYTYEDPDFTIPISLEYSFDGYRPGQHSGTVGYGWYLNCGGAITREVRGLPDERVSALDAAYNAPMRGWIAACADGMTTSWNPALIWSAHRLAFDSLDSGHYIGGFQGCGVLSDTPTIMGNYPNWRLYDMAPDLWHFKFLGHSGDFVILPDGRAKVFNCDLPSGELSVEFHDVDPSNPSPTITITDGNGTCYSFSADERSRSYADVVTMAEDPEWVVTGWRLSAVTAPNGRTAVLGRGIALSRSSHAGYGLETHGVWNNNSLDAVDQDLAGYFGDNPGLKYTLIQEESSVVTGISFQSPGGTDEPQRLVFGYGAADADEYADSCFVAPDAYRLGSPGPQGLLKSVSIYNADGVIVQRADLTYSCAVSGTPKSFLSSVSTSQGGTWSFTYDLTGYTLPKNDTQDTDHWGFWNGSGISDIRDHIRQPGTYIIQEGYSVMGPDSTEVQIPPVYGHTEVCHLYDQMADVAKEANAWYGMCGALIHIEYPTGGCSDITYEGNVVGRRMNAYPPSDSLALERVDATDLSATYAVGGVRVRSITDTDGEGGGFTRTFAYEDHSGIPSGILMQMPKYVEDALYNHYAQNGNGTLSCNATVNIRGFCNATGFQLTRDSHVAYACVRESHPDGSSTEQTFTSVADAGFEDASSKGDGFTKRVISVYDWIEPYDLMTSDKTIVTCDRSGMRGRPLVSVTRDAYGQEVRRLENAYIHESTGAMNICHNSTYYYHIKPWSAHTAVLSSSRETLHGATTRTSFSYNALGQKVCEDFISGTGATADTVRTEYAYLHESHDSAWFASNAALRRALASAVRTRLREGDRQTMAREEYFYGTDGNPKPVQIRIYPTEGQGAPRVTACEYDCLYRLLSLHTQPGDVLHLFTWAGNNLASSSVQDTAGGDSATTAYQWQDLVGPTLIEAPSGRREQYRYDHHARLLDIRDTAGDKIMEYRYKMINE